MTHASRSLVAVLYAKDAERLARFYENALGLARERRAAPDEAPDDDDDDGAIVVANGTVELVIVAVPEAVAAEITIGTPPEVRAETPLKLSFAVDAIAPLRASIEQAGGGLKPAPAAWSWRGATHLDGWDPEGNVFQLRAPL